MLSGVYCISNSTNENENQILLEEMYLNTSDGSVCMLIHQNEFGKSYGRHAYIDRSEIKPTRRLCGGKCLIMRAQLVSVRFISSSYESAIRTQSAVISLALKSLGVPCYRDDANNIYDENNYPICINIYDKSTEIIRQLCILNLGVESTSSNGLPSALSRYNINKEKLITTICSVFSKLFRGASRFETDEIKINNSINFSYINESEFLYEKENLMTANHKFAWGNFKIKLDIDNAVIKKCHIVSDAYEAEFLSKIEKSLLNCPTLISAVESRIFNIEHANKNMNIVRDVYSILENFLHDYKHIEK